MSQLGRTHWVEQLPIGTTIMVVEDDAVVRECLRELLADDCRVSDAVGAAEALERMTADGVPDVLVADMQLGLGMGGLELAAVARLQWPRVRAVLITGTSARDPVLGPSDRFLRKPFSVEALTHAVWELATRQDEVHTP